MSITPHDLMIADENYSAMQSAFIAWRETAQKYRGYKIAWEDAKNEFEEKETFVREEVAKVRDMRDRPVFPNDDMRDAETLRRMAQRFPQLVMAYQASMKFEREYRMLEKEAFQTLETARFTLQYESTRLAVLAALPAPAE